MSGSYAGVNAIQLSAVFSCARVIAEGLSQVPCILQRTSPKGGREAATDHPLYDLLARRPNSYQTSFEFREWIALQLALLGNAFVFVSRNARGQPIELIPLPHGSVSVSTPSFGEVLYRLNVVGNPIYEQRNIWHLRGPSMTSFEGLSLQAVAAQAMGLAANLETFGASLFSNGAKPSGMLTTDNELSPEQQKQLSDSWNAQQSGLANAHRTAVMSGGLKFEPVQTNANEAQFIESRRYQTEEICRIMRVNPLMVMQAADSSSYASVEQMFLAHQTHTLNPWYARFEQSAEAALLTNDDIKKGYRVFLDSREMTRGNATDQATYLAHMKQNGFMTTNEGRDFVGLDRFTDPDSDKPMPAANLYGPKSGTPAASDPK
ncbi:phage portal protein [Sphingomonas sp. Leaf242]|uniref:phage portal protein n=1 Tax=Sphingomonas sp. Leaf242 TaxID=1736304 RepID=UPI000A98731D|nr:phage portal protein [Sphingomonas sp. Leaf242]